MTSKHNKLINNKYYYIDHSNPKELILITYGKFGDIKIDIVSKKHLLNTFFIKDEARVDFTTNEFNDLYEEEYAVIDPHEINSPKILFKWSEASSDITPNSIINYGDAELIVNKVAEEIISGYNKTWYLVIIPTLGEFDTGEVTPFNMGKVKQHHLEILIMDRLDIDEDNNSIHKHVLKNHHTVFDNLKENQIETLKSNIDDAKTTFVDKKEPELEPIQLEIEDDSELVADDINVIDKSNGKQEKTETYNEDKVIKTETKEDDSTMSEEKNVTEEIESKEKDVLEEESNNTDNIKTEDTDVDNSTKPEDDNIEFNQPLATRMRPTRLSEVVGQEHLIGEGKMLSMMVKSNQLNSIILYGLPGIGKTSIAHALAGELNTEFEYHNAGVDNKKDLQDATKKGKIGDPVIILIDEIHRLNKPNQDFLLPQIESGKIIVVGATTENPYINTNSALRSRSRVLELNQVDKGSILKRLNTAMNDKERGLGQYNIEIDNALLEHIAVQANGDLRNALNTLELASISTQPNDDNIRVVTQEMVNNCLQQRQIGGDKDGDTHYNLLSAFQKSIRGSDADAALHYLARLLEAGDIVSINRRLLVMAYEDVGLADPNMGAEATSAIKAVESLGLPEARIPLAQLTVRLAMSPKSNVAYRGIDNAIEALYLDRNLEIPKHLHDTHYKGAKVLGKGVGYKYAHDYEFGVTNQQHLPDDFVDDRYLEFRIDGDNIPPTSTHARYNSINRVVKGKE